MSTYELLVEPEGWVPEIGLGDRLRVVRRKKHRTQDEMAALLGVKKVTYASWEAGMGTPAYDVVVRIARLLSRRDGVPMWWTLGDDDPSLRDAWGRARQDSNLQPSDPKVDVWRPRRDRRRRRDWQRTAAPLHLSLVRCEDAA